jgi:hypothetical protein
LPNDDSRRQSDRAGLGGIVEKCRETTGKIKRSRVGDCERWIGWSGAVGRHARRKQMRASRHVPGSASSGVVGSYSRDVETSYRSISENSQDYKIHLPNRVQEYSATSINHPSHQSVEQGADVRRRSLIEPLYVDERLGLA